MFPIFGQDEKGTVVIERFIDASEAAAQLNKLQPAAPLEGGRKNPILPYKGDGGILTRYFKDTVVRGGKGEMDVLKHIKSFGLDLQESFEHAGVENTETGLYHTLSARSTKLFVNMGSGAVIFEDLPANDGAVKINYYGDTLGWRELEVTPYHMAAEILNDLNEAFKMMMKYSK